MSLPDLDAVRPLARRDGEPTFDEPWQAQVLAVAFNLMERGVFDNMNWSDTLGAALAAAAQRDAPDTPQTYYECVLEALETLLLDSGVATAELDERTAAWRKAYLSTPHGEPVKLGVT